MKNYYPPSRLILTGTLFCAALLTACAPVGRGVQRVSSNLHEETVAFDHRVRDWFDSENLAMKEREKNLRIPDTAYCYRTLGEISCYRHPLVGQQSRLVGKQVPEPMFHPLEYPMPDEKPEPPLPEDEQNVEVVVVERVEVLERPAPVVIHELEPATVVQIPVYEPQTDIPVVVREEAGLPRQLMPPLSAQ